MLGAFVALGLCVLERCPVRLAFAKPADIFQRDSLFYQAMQLGEYATAGLPPEALESRVAKLRAVTPAQVQEVARKYLIDDALTVAVLDPQPLESKPNRPAVSGVRHAN